MNILIVHNKYRYRGGEESVVENESRILRENGNNVFYYFRDSKEIDNMNLFNKIKSLFSSIYSFKSYKEISKLIKEHDVDAVHVHNVVPLISFSAYYAAKNNGCQLIQTLHNYRLLCPNGLFYRNNIICTECVKCGLKQSIKYNCYRNSKLQTAIMSFNLWFHRKIGTFNKVDKYITFTEFSKSIFSNALPKEKIIVRTQFCNNDSIEEKQTVGDYYLIVSRLEDSKGIEIAIKAFELEKNQKLIIVGTGSDEDKYRKYVEENNINNIEFVGQRNKEDVLEYMKNAKALIIPSRWYEGYPMTIIEALSLSLPIIGNDIGNVSSIITNEKIGYIFKKNDHNDLAKLIRELSNQELTSMSKSIYSHFKDKHSNQRIYEETIKIYKGEM